MYNELLLKAKSIAENNFLISWSENANTVDFRIYETIINNLRHWLAPTAKRLSFGLDILKSSDLEKYAPLIEAFEHNIEDEKGSCKEEAHAYLFNKSAITYSHVVYGKSLNFSKGLESTMNLKIKSEGLFKDDLFTMLGASLAQEIHALPQLELLFKGFSLNKGKFSSIEWGDVSYFYDIHLDGTEARHAEDLNKVIWNYVDTQEKEELFLKGFYGLLDDLTSFWNGVSNETGLKTCL